MSFPNFKSKWSLIATNMLQRSSFVDYDSLYSFTDLFLSASFVLHVAVWTNNIYLSDLGTSNSWDTPSCGYMTSWHAVTNMDTVLFRPMYILGLLFGLCLLLASRVSMDWLHRQNVWFTNLLMFIRWPLLSIVVRPCCIPFWVKFAAAGRLCKKENSVQKTSAPYKTHKSATED